MMRPRMKTSFDAYICGVDFCRYWSQFADNIAQVNF